MRKITDLALVSHSQTTTSFLHGKESHRPQKGLVCGLATQDYGAIYVECIYDDMKVLPCPIFIVGMRKG